MSRKREGSRNRQRRGASAKPTVQQLRRDIRPPELETRAPERSRIRTAMTREVAPELAGVVQQPAQLVRRPVRTQQRAAPARTVQPLTTQGQKPAQRNKPTKTTVKPSARPVSKKRLDIAPDRQCKGKPTKTRGNGGSRPFVPWCK